MSVTKKNLVIISGMLILLGHFLMIGNYISNPGIFSNYYSYPFFQQNWNVFVPPPSNNYRLFVSDENGTCKDVFEEIRVKHQSNRFRGSGAFLIALSNAIHYFEIETLHESVEKGVIRNNVNFKLIRNMAVNYLKNQGETGFENPKLILMVTPLNGTIKSIYYNQGENVYLWPAK